MFKSAGLAKMFAGRRKFFRGPHAARGPHVRHLCYRHTGSHFIFAGRRRKIIRKVLFTRRQRFYISSGRLAYNIQVILAVQHVSYFLIFQWATYFHFFEAVVSVFRLVDVDNIFYKQVALQTVHTMAIKYHLVATSRASVTSQTAFIT